MRNTKSNRTDLSICENLLTTVWLYKLRVASPLMEERVNHSGDRVGTVGNPSGKKIK